MDFAALLEQSGLRLTTGDRRIQAALRIGQVVHARTITGTVFRIAIEGNSLVVEELPDHQPHPAMVLVETVEPSGNRQDAKDFPIYLSDPTPTTPWLHRLMAETIGLNLVDFAGRYRSALASALRRDPRLLVICSKSAGAAELELVKLAFEAGLEILLVRFTDQAPPGTNWLDKEVVALDHDIQPQQDEACADDNHAVQIRPSEDLQQQLAAAREEGARDEQDRLAMTLFERGGYGTLQLSRDPDYIPRMRFVDPSEVQPVDAVRLGDSTLLIRTPKQ